MTVSTSTPDSRITFTSRLGPGRLLLLFGFAALMRLAFVAVWGGWNAPIRFPDAQEYWFTAQALADGDGLVDPRGFRATRMPVYPAFLSLFVRFDGGLGAARAAQAILGATAAVAIACLGCRLGGPVLGLLCGLAVAVDPFLLFCSNLLLTETLFIAALCVTWYAAWTVVDADGPAPTRAYLVAGACFALCAYLRPSAAGLLLVFGAFVVARSVRAPRAWLRFGLTVAVVMALLAPWAWRNQRVTGEWRWLTNRMGISLWDGLGPQADGSSDLAHTADMPEIRGLTESEWNRFFRTEALKAAREDPARTLRLAWVKMGRTWNPFPNVSEYQSWLIRWVSAGWAAPIYGLAIIGIWTWRHRPWVVLWLLAPAGYFTVLHTVFVGSMRYRLPAMPFLELLAAVGAIAVWTFVRGRKASPGHGSGNPPLTA